MPQHNNRVVTFVVVPVLLSVFGSLGFAAQDRYPNLNAITGRSKGLAATAQAQRLTGAVMPEYASAEEKTTARN